MTDKSRIFEPRSVGRREFLQWSSLVTGWAAVAEGAPEPHGAAGPEAQATLLADGDFRYQGRGWQLGPGCEIVAGRNAPTAQVLHVKNRGSSTARALILSPFPGRTYTVQGFMRTSGVKALEAGGCAVMSLDRYEFAGRHVGGGTFAKLTGTADWTPFSHTFRCDPDVYWLVPAQPSIIWLELALGLYRAEGEAWFAGLTIVEGDHPAAISDVVPREEHRGQVSPSRNLLASVAIWRDRVPVQGTASDPEFLRETLQQAGYDAEFITSEQLADPAHLTRARYDILALPYGASFPAAAQAALQAFLGQGGSFFSTGGYAFNNPLLKGRTGWVTETEALASEPGVEIAREGDFENGLEACQAAGWKISDPLQCSLDSGQAHAGHRSAKVSAGDENCRKVASWEFEAGADHERERFELTCWAKAEAVSDRFDGYAYIALEQLDGARKLLRETRTEIVRLRGTSGWKLFAGETIIYPEAKWVRIAFGLYHASGTLWVDQVSLRRKSDDIRINTARGTARDGLDVAPEQIGVFDPDYRLRRVAYLSTAPGQDVVKTAYRLNAEVTGYAASGVLGAANARWTPLVNAYDGYGRLRGAAGALMRHYNGAYRKSHWAFFGVDTCDLFASNNPGARALLLEVFDALQRKTFLHEARTNFACYRQGEEVRIFSWVSNYSSRPRQVTVTTTVFDDGSGKRQFHHQREMKLAPDQSCSLETTWAPGKFDSHHYTVRIELSESGKTLDHVETGFLVWDEKVVTGGFPLKYSGNYFRWKDRAVFLQGTDDYIHTFVNLHENPKTWYADLRKVKDHGLLVYEQAMGCRGVDDVPTEAWWRECDAMVQMCSELELVIFPGMLIFADTSISNVDFEHQKEFCRAFAKRYALAPGLIYYLNGDLQVRHPEIPDVQALFTEYLKRKYGTDQRLTEAWHVSPPEAKIGALKAVGGTDRWDDVRTYDNYRFRTDIVRRWLDTLSGEIRKIDPEHLVNAEFYTRPAEGMDVITAIGSLAPGNIGYYDLAGDDVYMFPQCLRYVDMRARGKSINVGEFGNKTHPAWLTHTRLQRARTEEEENQLFLSAPHYTLGTGGSRIQNWCWKYPADFPFEWGTNYPCDTVSRDALLYYRNTGLFFRQFDLKYQSPEMFFLIADHHRMGAQGDIVRLAQLNGIRYLLNLHCEFATIDEFYLEDLPSSCRVLVYPVPFCPDDATFDRVYKFVEDGGTLYVSGDISYDTDRRRSRTGRLEKLLGVQFQSEVYPNIAFEGHGSGIRPSGKLSGLAAYEGYPCIRVKPTSAEVQARDSGGEPVIFTNKVGRGRVFYSTDILEFHAPARTTACGPMVYGSFLEWAGVKRPRVEPDNPWIHFFRLATREGGELFTLVNRDEATPRHEIRFQTPAGPVRVDVARRMTGALGVTAGGAIHAIETSGTVSGNQGVYCQSTSHVMLFSLDQKDVRESEMLCLLPMGEGRVRITAHGTSGPAQFQVGEFRAAKWVPLERGQLVVQDNCLDVTINRDRNLSIILIASPNRMREAAKRLVDLLTLSWR